ncbi:MAG: hypothetical protein R2717_06120 [Schumannella sp.]
MPPSTSPKPIAVAQSARVRPPQPWAEGDEQDGGREGQRSATIPSGPVVGKIVTARAAPISTLIEPTTIPAASSGPTRAG